MDIARRDMTVPMSTPDDVSARYLRILLPVLSLLLFVPILQSIYWPAANGLDIVGYPLGRDFINIWTGPRLAFGGDMAALFNLDAYNAGIAREFGQTLPWHNWSYPLFTLILFRPLAQLPYFAALAVWTFGLFAIFAAVTASQIERQQRIVALALLVLAPAVLINAVGGQNGFLSAILLLGGVLLIERRPVLAGILFGLLTYKPQLGLVLPFVLLALGAWRTIAAAVVTTIVLVAASVAVFGVEPWRTYIEVTGPLQVQILERFQGFGMYMLTSVMSAVRSAGFPLQAAFAAQIALAVPVIAVAAWAIRQTSDPARRAFVLVAATMLATPYALVYDFPALTAVMLWNLCRTQPLGFGRAALLLAAWLTPLAAMYLNARGLTLAPFAVFAVFALAVRDAIWEGRVARPAPAAPLLGSGAAA